MRHHREQHGRTNLHSAFIEPIQWASPAGLLRAPGLTALESGSAIPHCPASSKKASPPVDKLFFEQAIDELDQLVRKIDRANCRSTIRSQPIAVARNSRATASPGSPTRSRKSGSSKATCWSRAESGRAERRNGSRVARRWCCRRVPAHRPLRPWAAERAERVEAAAQRMLPPVDAMPATPARGDALPPCSTSGKRVRPLLVFAGGEVTDAEDAGARPRRTCRRVRARVLACARRHAVHGQRRAAAGQADGSRGVRRGHRHARRRCPAGRGVQGAGGGRAAGRADRFADARTRAGVRHDGHVRRAGDRPGGGRQHEHDLRGPGADAPHEDRARC